MTSTTTTLHKTRTAADYVHTHSPSADTRCHAGLVLRTHAALHAMSGGATDPADATTLRELVQAVAACVGTDWLSARAHDPDIGRLTILLNAPHLIPSDLADLDVLLSTALWTRHGPQPAPD
ncbi:hypothetical protein BJF79_23725 [Actinomadura sp. CNU-125]|uniref:hypothetical protein n=1 Tax=Actinomadura sp. CNU-125 TaxID=1904961 RepID=UPI00095CEB83|nr:hypothetical protein [Actinomadura sp. CNU-125]OLT11733.1 hypothetical protein BJF79_23725 [Actinomadura sp. CNU-125]